MNQYFTNLITSLFFLQLFESSAKTSEIKPVESAVIKKCIDTDNGKNRFKKGRVIYHITSQTCISNSSSNSKQCLSQVIVDKDKCQNETTLIEQICNTQNLGESVIIHCKCSNGVCVR